jgi:hypothetical protein
MISSRLGKTNLGWAIALAVAAGFHMPAFCATYFVAPTGSDGQLGNLEQPFATIARGQAAVTAGDTVYIRGGNYIYKSTTLETAVTLNKSGAPGLLIHYLAFPGEIPVFDFYGMTAMKRIRGVLVTASYIHLKGLEMKGVPQNLRDGISHENWCVYVSNGSGNVFELLNLHHNMGPGLFISEGANNLVLNCDSHDNFDPFSYAGGKLVPGENADGFGFHGHNPTSTGNVFRGCRAWWNADDGYDFIGAATPVLVENCWAWNSGYRTGTLQLAGNGNGFKVGGYGMPLNNPPARLPQHMVRFCLAFNNRSAGFYQNHHPIANFYFNNTSFNNRSSNFSLLGYDLAAGGNANMGILRNNVAFMGTNLAFATGGKVDAANNSWNQSGLVSAVEFESVDTAGVSGPRRADGALPLVGFMKPKPGSMLIDKGVLLNLPYSGLAPDLGAFELGLQTGLVEIRRSLNVGAHEAWGWPGESDFDVKGRRTIAGKTAFRSLRSVF